MPLVTFICAANTAWLTAALVRMRRIAPGDSFQYWSQTRLIEFSHSFRIEHADLVQVCHTLVHGGKEPLSYVFAMSFSSRGAGFNDFQ